MVGNFRYPNEFPKHAGLPPLQTNCFLGLRAPVVRRCLENEMQLILDFRQGVLVENVQRIDYIINKHMLQQLAIHPKKGAKTACFQ